MLGGGAADKQQLLLVTHLAIVTTSSGLSRLSLAAIVSLHIAAHSDRMHYSFIEKAAQTSPGVAEERERERERV